MDPTVGLAQVWGQGRFTGCPRSFSCFSVVLNMLGSISNRSSCSACERHLSLYGCKNGCLPDLTAVELFLLLAHAISEELEE